MFLSTWRSPFFFVVGASRNLFFQNDNRFGVFERYLTTAYAVEKNSAVTGINSTASAERDLILTAVYGALLNVEDLLAVLGRG